MQFNPRFIHSLDFWSGLLIMVLMIWNIMPIRVASLFWWVCLLLFVGGIYYFAKGLVRIK
ncbi:hypothetical protein [Levilactobacillus brevis]|uniref:hypothetical protein n=1 Tax=Levilactobacillus brevis TaxID=1580 RepID=UPI001C1EB341|nr:hypothetical protein [Levilactobacillus brevis]MBU7538473.1 hypothetical protein [Levilactobacillus brevis]MBU7558107.1 hypothetical protein [Levilactobacillus brevis]MCE6016748.1 hypothetical protein [Levilactobacillus brevis]MCE6019154.1 hypothetical protein [Levilactobacillus brevis]MCE6026851.1 hypothetical protein [Levilactobacillus brevis]